MTKTVRFYVDPMCAWCWAMKPTIEKMRQQIGSTAKVELFMGGMRVRGNTKKIEGEYKAYLKQVFDRVNDLSGQTMNKSVLETEGLYFDSEYPCRAVIQVKQQRGNDAAFEYLQKIQAAYFIDGKNITQPAVLAGLADTEFCDDIELFLAGLIGNENEDLSFLEFNFVKQQNVQGFPAMHILDADRVVHNISGFVPYEQAKQIIEQALL